MFCLEQAHMEMKMEMEVDVVGEKTEKNRHIHTAWLTNFVPGKWATIHYSLSTADSTNICLSETLVTLALGRT